MIVPASGVLRAARAVERRAEDAILRSLALVLDSRLAQQAVDIALSSAVAERLVATAPQQIADRMLSDGAADAIAARLAAGPELERITAAALDTPAARRLVAQVIESSVADEAVVRLLESEDLWILVDQIAQSPAVTEAISHQGVGLAEEVAEVVRARSRRADARLERAARRLLRRDGRAAPSAE